MTILKITKVTAHFVTLEKSNLDCIYTHDLAESLWRKGLRLIDVVVIHENLVYLLCERMNPDPSPVKYIDVNQGDEIDV